MSEQRSAAQTVLAGAAATVALVAALRGIQRAMRRTSLRDKVVVITGGSRGLGLELAREFLRHGSKVAICGRNEETLERAVSRLRQESGSTDVYGFACDVTRQAQVEDMVNNVRFRLGRIDVLVNNAGIIEVGPLEVMEVADFDECMKTHFWAPLYTTLAVLPEMQQRGAGRIVNIASIGGKVSVPHLLPYNTSKFALVGLSEGLRAELLKDNIYVTTVCPGLMRTGSPRNATFKGQHQKEYAWFSVSDSLPLVAMNSARAARQIVDACRYGAAEVILTPQARLATAMQGLAPGLMSDILSLVHAVLPAAGGIGKQRALGRESFSAASPSWLTALDERAAQRNNQVA